MKNKKPNMPNWKLAYLRLFFLNLIYLFIYESGSIFFLLQVHG